MLPPEPAAPAPSRSMEELTQIGLGHVRRFRARRRLQTGVAIGVTIVVLAAVAIPLALRTPDVGEVENIAPIDQPQDGRPVDGGSSVGSGEPSQGAGRGAARIGRSGASASKGTAAEVKSGPGAAGLQFGGEHIAFASYRDNRSRAEIYTMLPDGEGVRRLTADGARDSKPAWSPDGLQVAYVSEDLDRDIVVVRADGSATYNATDTDGRHETDPAWSPDGEWIVFSSSVVNEFESSDLYLLHLASGELRRLTDTPEIDEWGAVWSPDGTQIAFERIDWDMDNYQRGIYLMEADGSRLRRLTNGRDVEPAWSPDGRQIAFVRVGNVGEPETGAINTTPADSSSVYVMNADGSGLRRLTHDSKVLDYGPAWSPDGSNIIFTRDPDGAKNAVVRFASGMEGGPLSSIYVIGADGSNIRELTDPASGDFYADWYGPPA